MAELDVDAMITRFKERAKAVKERPLPPVAGDERRNFIEQAQRDFMDFAIIGDASWDLTHGVLTFPVTDASACALRTQLVSCHYTRTWLSW